MSFIFREKNTPYYENKKLIFKEDKKMKNVLEWIFKVIIVAFGILIGLSIVTSAGPMVLLLVIIFCSVKLVAMAKDKKDRS